jgi:hypothetical protein
MSALLRHWRALPGAMRLGFGVLVLGLLADAAYHAAFGIEPSHHDAHAGVPLAIHGLVAVGMGLTLVGVASSALVRRRRSSSSEGGR